MKSLRVSHGLLANLLLVGSSLGAQALTRQVWTPPAGPRPGTVRFETKISETQGGFGLGLLAQDRMGTGVVGLGDLNGDGVQDIAVGAPGRILTPGPPEEYADGAIYVLFLAPDGSVASQQKINEMEGGFNGELAGGLFGSSLANLGDVDGDGVIDLAVGATWDSGGFGFPVNFGAVWILFMNTDGTVKSEHYISSLVVGAGTYAQRFGQGVTGMGDLDGNGVPDLAIGAPFHPQTGAVWILFLESDGTIASTSTLASGTGGIGHLFPGESFGSDVARLEDLDGNGVPELAVGSEATNKVYILFMSNDGTASSYTIISEGQSSFSGDLHAADRFGKSLAPLADLDGDGIGELAVGAYEDDDGGLNRGAVWVLFLNSDGTVHRHQKLSELHGGFAGPLNDEDGWGRSVAGIGDLNGDGFEELLVGAPEDDDGPGGNRGAAYVLFLRGRM
jgi:hypothetical protein